jgi:hypothetical protein
MFDETVTIAGHGPMASTLRKWTKEGIHAMLYMTIRWRLLAIMNMGFSATRRTGSHPHTTLAQPPNPNAFGCIKSPK